METCLLNKSWSLWLEPFHPSDPGIESICYDCMNLGHSFEKIVQRVLSFVERSIIIRATTVENGVYVYRRRQKILNILLYSEQ